MKSIVHELFQTIDSRDWNQLPQFFHPEVVYERPGYPVLKGISRLDNFYREERVIAAGAHHIEAVVIDGNHAACWGRFVGAHKDGSSIDEAFADVYTLVDNRIRHRKSFFFRPAV